MAFGRKKITSEVENPTPVTETLAPAAETPAPAEPDTKSLVEAAIASEKAYEKEAKHDEKQAKRDEKAANAALKQEKKDAKRAAKENTKAARKELKAAKKELRRAEKEQNKETPEQKERRKRRGKRAFWLIIVLLLVAAIFYFFIWPVRVTRSELEVELGSELSTEPADYLTGSEIGLLLSAVDISNVDVNTVGDYMINCEHGRSSYPVLVHVRDRVAPQITERADAIYLAAGREVQLKDLIMEAYDASGQIDLSISELALMAPMNYPNAEQKIQDASGDAAPAGSVEEVSDVHDSFTAGSYEGVAMVDISKDIPTQIVYSFQDVQTSGGSGDAGSSLLISQMDTTGNADADTTIYTTGGITIEEPGVYSAVLTAEDPSGNQTTVKLLFTVDTAPQITGLCESYVILGAKEAVQAKVGASDDLDGDLSASVIFNDSDVNWDTIGDYTLKCSVTDSYGLQSEATATVHVMDLKDIDEKLSYRETGSGDTFIYGADNAFSAGTLEMELADQEEYMLPTAVRINMLNEAQTSGNFGCGFIVYMDETEIYICSNAHVLQYWNEFSRVYFYDGTEIAAGEVVGSDEDEDIAFLKLATADVPAETLASLKYVQMDLDTYQKATQGGTEVFMNIVGTDGFEYVREGETKRLTSVFSLVNSKTLVTSVAAVSGNSGSALIAKDGTLIGMNVGYHHENGKKTYVAITPDRIYEEFLDLVGLPLYVRGAA